MKNIHKHLFMGVINIISLIPIHYQYIYIYITCIYFGF